MLHIGAYFKCMCAYDVINNWRIDSMKNEAGKAVEKEVAAVDKEQGAPKEAGSEPPKSFGHGSASSGGVSGSIPKES